MEEKIPYQEVIQCLNKVCGTHYQFTTKATRELIRARWNEGFRPEDFLRVIDVKAREWLHDPHMVKFLRPQTLFSSKFEAYLNQKEIGSGKHPSKTDWENEPDL